ncbi:MAG: hypothetical protein ACP5N2_04630 [Candidatus Nanoarchaeia archaeon]
MPLPFYSTIPPEVREDYKQQQKAKKLQKLKEEWRFDLEPIFDIKHIEKKKHILDGLVGNIYASGLDKIRQLKQENPNIKIIYVSEHLSEQDFVEEQKLFYREGLELPGIFGGINLLVLGLTQPTVLFGKPIIVDLKKCGLIGINRQLLDGKGEKNSAYRKVYLEFLLGNKEVDSIFNRHDTLIFNYGRTKDGKVRNYDFHTLDSFHQVSLRNPEYNHVVVPISVSQTRCIEDSSFKFQDSIKNSHLPFIDSLAEHYKWANDVKTSWKKHVDKIGAIGDIGNFLTFYLKNQPRGDIHFDFAEPIPAAEYKKNQTNELKTKITTEINSMIRAAPTNLLAHILKYYPEEYVTNDKLYSRMTELRRLLPETLPLSRQAEELDDMQVVEIGKDILMKKRHNGALKLKGQAYRINKDSFLLTYYTNRIAHHHLPIIR